MEKKPENQEEIKSSTHSPLGSIHWFRTIVGNMLRVGEFLAEHGNAKPELIKPYGKSIYDTCKELLAGHSKINNQPSELNDHDKELLYGIELLLVKHKDDLFAKQETERLQAENKAMRELLEEIRKDAACYELEDYDEYYEKKISTLLNQQHGEH